MKMHRVHVLSAALVATLLVGGCATRAPAPSPAQQSRIADQGRLIPLEGALNVRTFEGLQGKRGPVPAGSFVRAADLSRLTAADLDRLAERGIELGLDLRTAEEAAGAPDLLANDRRFRYERISLLGTEKLDLQNLPGDLGTMYVAALEANQPQFRRVFETIAAEPEGTVLFHCTAGKDRTGMVAALLLSLAGVSRQDIIQDYAVSARYLEPMMKSNPQLEAMMRQNPKIKALGGSPAAAMEAFLGALERQHGGAEAYLRKIGVGEADIGRLMERLGQGS